MAEAPVLQLVDAVRRRFGVDFGGARLDVLVEHLQTLDADLNAAALRLLGGDRQRLADFVGRITNTETYFFRHLDHFEALRALVPQRLRATGASVFRVWSAGCSTGEEPLSLAATLLDVLPPTASLSVVATDINASALARAQAARYTEWSFRGVTPDQRHRYFRPDEGFFVPRDPLRRAVTYRRHNLLDGTPEPLPFDLVVCRNVLIYFDAHQLAQAVNLLSLAVSPGGLLVLGPTESPAARLPDFDAVHQFGCLVHVKRDPGPGWTGLGPAPWPSAPAPSGPLPSAPPMSAPRPSAPAPSAPFPSAPFPSAPPLSAPRPSAPAPPPAAMHVEDSLDRARALADQGRLDEARALAQRFVGREVLGGEAQLLLALLALDQGDTSKAVSELEAAIASDPSLAMAHYLMGSLLESAAGPGAAEHAYQQALVALHGAGPDDTVRASGGIAVRDLVTTIDSALARARKAHA